MKGETIQVPVDEQIIFNQLDTNPAAIWSLLLASGYLKVVHTTSFREPDTYLAEQSHQYEIRSNRESGYGRYDVMMIPRGDDLPAVILEFKLFSVKRGEKSLIYCGRNRFFTLEDRTGRSDYGGALDFWCTQKGLEANADKGFRRKRCTQAWGDGNTGRQGTLALEHSNVYVQLL